MSPQLRTAFELIDLPYLSVVKREDLLPLVNDANGVKARWATRMLKRLDAGDQFEAAYRTRCMPGSSVRRCCGSAWGPRPWSTTP